ncbi:MAG TPA: hypothetical protein VGD52_10960 [Pseudoduganella sp.]
MCFSAGASLSTATVVACLALAGTALAAYYFLRILLTWWAFVYWLVSVWCFFAALLSVLVLAHGLNTSHHEEPRTCPS